MKKLFAIILLALVSVSCASITNATPTRLATETVTHTPAPSDTPTRIPASPTSAQPTDIPSPTQTATQTQTPTRTFTPSRTPTLTRTATPTRTPTLTPYPTYTPLATTALDAVGVPIQPRQNAPRYSDQVNKANAHIYRRTIHQRDVAVYVEQEGVLTQDQEIERANFCFEAWSRAWEIFGGYAYSTYECVISDRLGDAGRGSSGYASWSRFAASRTLGVSWKELMQHEIFHSWDAGQMPFEDLWIVEGLAQYYNYFLVDPNRVLELTRAGSGPSYQTWIKQGLDGPLATIKRGDANEGLAYYKAQVVWYMLDVEISERTNGAKSLNNVLRRLYLQYGVQGVLPNERKYVPHQQMYDAVIAEAGSPDFFNAFFNDYVENARSLLDWHNGLFKTPSALTVPDHPAIR